MPYKLRKAPKKELYWVVNKETGAKHSKEPLPKETAKKQMKALYASESGYKLRGGAREVRPNGAGAFAIMDGNQQVAGPYDTQEQAEIALMALDNRDRIRAAAERARRAMADARAKVDDPAPPSRTPPRRQSSEDPTGEGRLRGRGTRSENAINNMKTLRHKYGFTEDETDQVAETFKTLLSEKSKGFLSRKHTQQQIDDAMKDAIQFQKAQKGREVEAGSPKSPTSPFKAEGFLHLPNKAKRDIVVQKLATNQYNLRKGEAEVPLPEVERDWAKMNQSPDLERSVKNELKYMLDRDSRASGVGEAGLENLTRAATEARRQLIAPARAAMEAGLDGRGSGRHHSLPSNAEGVFFDDL